MRAPERPAKDVHGYYHDWYPRTDEVLSERRKTILIARHLNCYDCSTTATDQILITGREWERVGHRAYKYDKAHPFTKYTASEQLRENFLATTDLPEEMKRKLELAA